MASESNEEFLRRLSQEFGAERSIEILRELIASFDSYMRGPGLDRVQAHLEQMQADPVTASFPQEYQFASASSRAGAEAVLAAVSVYLARHETPAAAAS